MKQGKKPTVREKKLLEANGYDHKDYLTAKHTYHSEFNLVTFLKRADSTKLVLLEHK